MKAAIAVGKNPEVLLMMMTAATTTMHQWFGQKIDEKKIILPIKTNTSSRWP